ncbi:MAG: family 20 glycosylhydrolase [Candidatus Lokiarchaeota archaeon]|nr:family 20 glycosylhydrolase [Candidatus Lokiarchaeota archaeon]
MIQFEIPLGQEIQIMPNIFDFDLSTQIIPSPQKVLKKNNNGIEIPFIINLSVRGSFTPATELKMLEGMYYLKEPKWNIDEFIEHIDDWLTERWDHIKNIPKLKIKTQEIKADASIENESYLKETPDDKKSQAYHLKCNRDKIVLSAWSKHGSYYGFLTLSQLFTIKQNRLYLPVCEIWDYPDYVYRGLEDDISRGQRPTMDHFKEFIKFLSRLKLNAEGLYIEDMYKFEKYPEIGKGRNPLKQEEIQDLEKYAIEHFVEIQPAVEMFGHMDNMLTLPKFRKYGEFPGAQCLDVSSEETRELVDDLLNELCDAFTSETFHLVCDESFDFGLYRSRNYVKKNGKAEVLAEWYLYLVDVIRKYGKEIPGFAHDIIIHYPKTLELVKDDIPLIHYWSYGDKKKYRGISKLKKKGFHVAAVPTTFDWSRHYPYFDYAEKNTVYMGKDGLERGAEFLITTKFGDFFNENLRENIRYGLVLEAQASWNVKSKLLWDKDGKLDCSLLRKSFIKYYFDTADQRILKCMDLLNKQNDVLPTFPNGMFNRYWMDPYCRKIKKKELNYQKRFLKEASYILRTIKNLRTKRVIKRNEFHLEYIEFAARMTLHFAVKILAAEAAWKKNFELIKPAIEILKVLMELELIPAVEIPKNRIDEYKELIPFFKWLSKDIKNQRSIYRKLWLKLAVKEGLEYPDHRFEVLNWYYQRSIKDLSQNQKPRHNQLSAEWIWRNGLRKSWNWGNRVPNYFYKILKPEKEIKKVSIQCIASNYLDLFVNGEKIGTVLSRFSLSQLPMAKSVQLFDITENIDRNKENIISIEGWNYANGIGGFNAIIHVEYTDGTVRNVISDESWHYTESTPRQWPIKNIDGLDDQDNWGNARSFGSPPGAWNGPISKPNWEQGWKSEISFSFGLRNFAETSVTSFVPETLFKILFWLAPVGIKLMGVDIYNFREF